MVSERLVVNNVTIIGLGLIGGSWAMALKRTSPGMRICGVDVDSEALKTGLRSGVIDRGTEDAASGVKDADLVVIATFVASIPEIAEKIAPHLKPGCILTDTGSTKLKTTESLGNVLPPGVHYIGGHPMTGSEISGISGADPYLFENAVYVLTPDSSTDRRALAVLRDLIETMGARVLYLSPEEHDRMVAAVSHLPHVVAAALVNTVGEFEEHNPGAFRLAAGGFRDVTRIAESRPGMWCDIFMQNREAVLSLIGAFKRSLEEFERTIRDSDEPALYELLATARRRRGLIPQNKKGLLPELHEITVTVPDKPGVIAGMTGLLGRENINIMDIEILRVREGDGGTIRLGFKEKDVAYRALEILHSSGYIAKLR